MQSHSVYHLQWGSRSPPPWCSMFESPCRLGRSYLNHGYDYAIIGSLLGPKDWDIELHNPQANAVPRIFDQYKPGDVRINLLGANCKAIDKFDMIKVWDRVSIIPKSSSKYSKYKFTAIVSALMMDLRWLCAMEDVESGSILDVLTRSFAETRNGSVTIVFSMYVKYKVLVYL